MALLAGTVVVVSGVGPGLGRSIALASAREGADVVLAARTAARLDEVAKEVTALGRRALAVPADITDEASAAHLAQAALGGVRPGRHAGAQRVRDPAADQPRRRRPGRAPGRLRHQRHRGAAADPRCSPRPWRPARAPS